MKKPELVAPAGDWSSAYSAVEAGADSVYFGVKGLNMREGATNFDILELKKLMAYLHKNKKKGYLALNVIAFDKELAKIKTVLQEAKQAEVDAVILWDMAVFSLSKKLGLKIHLSTQASVSNSEALKFYKKAGAKRIILARECSLDEIKNIAKKTKCEIEAFIHGAMCVSISGRCFLSQYSFQKSANRGECIQPCRREYLITDTQKNAQYILGQDYILSPKDLCTIDFIDQIIESGVSALKIEGRIRSPEYIKVVTSSYRRAIDAYFQGALDKTLKKRLNKELFSVYNRGLSSGFYFGAPKDQTSRQLETQAEKIFLGQVTKFFKKIGVAEIHLQNHSLKKSETLLFYGKTTPARFAKAKELQINHKFVNGARKGRSVGVKVPFEIKPGEKVFIWKPR